MDSRAKQFGPASGLVVEIKRVSRTIGDVLGELWYREEQRCLLCGVPAREDVCEGCRDEYFLPLCERCSSCGKILPDHLGTRPEGARRVCSDCAQGKGPDCFDDVAVLGYYSGFWREWIKRVKFQGQPFLLAELSEDLANWVVRRLPPPDLIVPVPTHDARLKERGFNQTEVLASVLGGSLGLPWKCLLRKTKSTVSQTSLPREQRLANVREAFACCAKEEVVGKRIWLVDDVITTGATAGECGRVLREAGCRSLYGAVLAAGKEKEQAI